MGARHWVLGFVGMGVAVGLASAAGCGSSSSGGGAADAGDDSSDAAPCTPEDVLVPDSGACGACVNTMCATQIQACSADCTCGMNVDTLAMCLQTSPPPTLGPGANLTALFGTEAGAEFIAFLTCAGGAGGGAGALGGLGGGTAGGGATNMSSAAFNYASCLVMTCGGPCGFVMEGGIEGGPETGATEGGPSEASTGDSGNDGGTGSETGTGTEASGPDSSSSEAGNDSGSTGDAADGGTD